MHETVTQGRSKRSTAGNRMRELLEKAHQEDEKDALFEEDPDDAEFEAPAEVRDVYLDEFADTDEEVEDEEAEERQLRREERKKAKAKAGFNPLQPKTVRMGQATVQMPSAEELAILGPNIDVSKMAPSTLILEIRRRKREAKREQRSETRRSNLRASTLKTEADVIERERQEKIEKQNSRKGRKAQHVTGEIRGARPMTQAELIAAALEEEERNKEALTDWLRKEEERRELRRVGRKRVRGPRWTWVSRTVGRLVEVVEDDADVAPSITNRESTAPAAGDRPSETPAPETLQLRNSATATPAPGDDKDQKSTSPVPPRSSTATAEPTGVQSQKPSPAEPSTATKDSAASKPADTPSTAEVKGHDGKSDPQIGSEDPGAPQEPSAEGDSGKEVAEGSGKAATTEPTSTPKDEDVTDPKADSGANPFPTEAPAQNGEGPSAPGPEGGTKGPATDEPSKKDNSTAAPKDDSASKGEPKTEDKDSEAPTGPYTRNYLILSQVPGGLPAELKLILGDHVDWSDVKVVPARNRPINRKRPRDPLTGTPGPYRHPGAMIPYSSTESYATLQAVLANRYVFTPEGIWAGGEADAAAEGIDEIPGWKEACARGWLDGKRIPEDEPEPEPEVEPEEEEVEEVEEEEEVPEKSRGKRRKTEPAPSKAKGKAKAAPKAKAKAKQKPKKKAPSKAATKRKQ